MSESKARKASLFNDWKGWASVVVVVVIAIALTVAVIAWRGSLAEQEALDSVQSETSEEASAEPDSEEEESNEESQQSQQQSSAVQTTQEEPPSIIGQGEGVYGSEPLRGSSEEEVTDAAYRFATEFLESGFTSNGEMRAALRPLMTDSFFKKFETVEWYNVPNLSLEGNLQIFSVGTSDALVDVFLVRDQVMRVYLVNQNGWKVDDYGIR